MEAATMPDVLLDLPIKAAPERVFQAVSTPAGLECWWTQKSSGTPIIGATYELWFGPEYDWRAVVTQCEPPSRFELEMTRAMDDWMGTRVGFLLEDRPVLTWLRFRHTGWPGESEHYRTSCHCWSLYLRLLRRHVERSEFVPYERRLDV
jgi:uncharacterized protein YndB with AHSA1/START domain